MDSSSYLLRGQSDCQWNSGLLPVHSLSPISGLFLCLDLLRLLAFVVLSFFRGFLFSFPGTLAFLSFLLSSSGFSPPLAAGFSLSSSPFSGDLPTSGSFLAFSTGLPSPKGPLTPISMRSLSAPAQFRSAPSTAVSWYLFSCPPCKMPPRRK